MIIFDEWGTVTTLRLPICSPTPDEYEKKRSLQKLGGIESQALAGLLWAMSRSMTREVLVL